MKIIVPPIKCQGIKTKIVPKIISLLHAENYSRWVEPFLGSGVVAFNILPAKALLCDTNPYLIAFYSALQTDIITKESVKQHLMREGLLLQKKGAEHYYTVRARFNKEHSPLDFLFLNRACFNGMMRFNSKGDFNVPFCRKTERFAKAYISKIINQVEAVRKIIKMKDFKFICQDFRQTFSLLQEGDFLYCDPPYIDRHTDYFNSWNEKDEEDLLYLLNHVYVHFILSTWAGNEFRRNKYVEKYSKNFYMDTQEHFYHLGGEIKNRHSINEALFRNYKFQPICIDTARMEQPMLCL